MAANENTKFQINYKLADGTLINLYASDVKDHRNSKYLCGKSVFN